MKGQLHLKNRQSRYRKTIRGGYTLIELVVSSSIGAILVAGLSGSLYIASQSFTRNEGVSDQSAAQEILSNVMRDLNQAIRFTERTTAAVAFTVPDRTGDGVTETIRYAWGGMAGDSLTYEYNGSTPMTIASSVVSLNFAYRTRLKTALVPLPSNGANKLLMVMSDTTYPNSEEQIRENLFKSWSYLVTRIDDGAPQSAYDTALAANEVVYVSVHVSHTQLGPKLNGATIGVVNEEAELTNQLGFSSSRSYLTGTTIDITDNTHYITSGLAFGPLQLVVLSQPVTALAGTLAPGMKSLGLWGAEHGLAVLETGAILQDGSIASGRRVELPWGGGGFRVNQLTDAGLSMLRQALGWASGNDPAQKLPIAHWKLDEVSGTTAVDAVGGHNGFLVGGIWMAGKVNGGLGFSTSLVEVPYDVALDLPTTLSFSAWIRANTLQAGSNTIISRGLVANAQDYWFGTVGSELAIGFLSGGTLQTISSTGANLQTGGWHHVAATFDDAKDLVILYVDGLEVHRATTLLVPGASFQNLYLGSSVFEGYWDGVLDEVRIYNEVLSAGEISALVASGLGTATVGAVVEELNEAKLASRSSRTAEPPTGTSPRDLLRAAIDLVGQRPIAIAVEPAQ